MKTIAAVLLALIGLSAAYLAYDWVSVSKRRAAASSISLYSWKDASGGVHFSDKAPPPGALEVHRTRGQAYVPPPLAVRLKATLADWVARAGGGLAKLRGKDSARKSNR